MRFDFRRLSIRAQLLLLALGVILPGAGLFTLHLVEEYETARNAAHAEISAIAADAAGRLDQVLRNYAASLARITQRPLVRKLDRSACDPILREYAALDPGLLAIGLHDLRGNPVCTLHEGAPAQAAIAQSPWFQEAARGGKFYVSGAFLDPVLRRWVVVLAHPVLDPTGKNGGFLALSVDLLELNERVLRDVPRHAIVPVLDRADTFLLRSIEPEAWIGKPLPGAQSEAARGKRDEIFSTTDMSGRARFYATRTVEPAGWRVFAGVQADEVLGAINARRDRSLGIGFALLVCLSGFAWVLGASISRSIRKLSQTAVAVAGGREDVRAEIGGPAEVGEVSRQFNHMLEAMLRQRKASEAMAHRYATLQSHARDIVLLFDADGHVAEANEAAVQAYQYSLDELRGLHVSALRAEETLPRVQQQWNAAASGEGTLFETVHRRRDGSRFAVEVSSSVVQIDGAAYRQSFIRDITARKRADFLLHTRLNLSELGNSAGIDEILQAAIDAAEVVTESRIGFFHFVDADQENLTLQTWSTNTLKNMCKAEGKGRHYAISEAGVWVDCVRERQPVIHNDYAALPHKRGMPQGHAPLTRELVVPILRQGKVTEILGVGNKPTDYTQADVEAVWVIASMVQDIVERRRAETALQVSAEEYSSLLATSMDGFWVVSESDRLLDVNEAYCRMSGYSREELLALPSVDALLVAESPEAKRSHTAQIIRTGSMQMERRHRRKDGTVIDFEVTATYIPVSRKIFAFFRDVTERKRAEEARLNSQRMESLGTLAGGIAHDFNNILAAVRGNAELAAQDVGERHPAMVSLAEIRKAGERATELIRRIMAFGRPKEAHRDAVDLKAVIEEVLLLLRSTLPAGIVLGKRFAPEVPRVLADAAQVHEALVNLTTNAAYAIGRGTGLIEYALDAVQVDAGQAGGLNLSAGRYVRLTVKDNGCGMDAATQARIFDAFYTTKPAGEGTGLGLSMVHGIMRSHGGAIGVESAPGAGTSFHLYFPLAAEQVAQQAAQKPEGKAAAAAPAPAARRVMYVDDEEALVFLATRVLGRMGHSVSGFTAPREALEQFRAQPQLYDVVVTDLSMPKMSGFELARALVAVRPDIPILMTTGYVRAEDETVARESGIRKLVLKPATIDALAAELDALIREDKGG